MNIQETVRRDLESLGECIADWQGMTAGEIYAELDKDPNINVYWGFWSDNDLNTVVYP